MTRTIWRIATDTPDYEADDLTGAGSKITGGRWNEKGTPAVYASETRALACLETIVHLNAGALPFNRYLVAVECPDTLWKAARRVTAATANVGWDAEPAGRASMGLGTHWLRTGSSVLMVMPSVIVPEEFNILINPSHPDVGRLKATKIRRWIYDPRFST